MMEFLREHVWIIVAFMIVAQIATVWLLWPRPVARNSTANMIFMVIATTLVPLLGTLVLSEVLK